MTSNKDKVGSLIQLLEGEAKTLLNRVLGTVREEIKLPNGDPGTITDAIFREKILLGTAKQVLPTKFTTSLKRAMRQQMRKPQTMKVRHDVHRLHKLNGYLTTLFGPNKSIRMDEMKQIIENGLPNAWKDEMTIQGFEPYEDR